MAVGSFAAVTFPTVGPASAGSVPFTDPNANGFIGLCNRSEQPITSGGLLDVPFIWTAVSSSAAPNGYSRGEAALYAFQPRKDVPPDEWSGDVLTNSSYFTNPEHPMSQATNADVPLLPFTQEFPPRWDGLIELRLYFFSPDQGEERTTYPATVIRVSGNRWSVASGGTVPCNVGTATSVESFTLPKSELAAPPSYSVNPHRAGKSNHSGTSSSTSRRSTPVGGRQSALGNTAGGSPHGGGTSTVTDLLLAVGAAAVVGGAIAGVFIHRRRRTLSKA